MSDQRPTQPHLPNPAEPPQTSTNIRLDDKSDILVHQGARPHDYLKRGFYVDMFPTEAIFHKWSNIDLEIFLRKYLLDEETNKLRYYQYDGAKFLDCPFDEELQELGPRACSVLKRLQSRIRVEAHIRTTDLIARTTIKSVNDSGLLQNISGSIYYDLYYPSSSSSRRRNRFGYDDEGRFNVMIRETFVPLLKEVETAIRHRSGDIMLQGTSGSGKSHELTVLVCYLMAQEKKVVFLPDCKKLLRTPTLGVIDALIQAFHGDRNMQYKILDCGLDRSKISELLHFHEERLIFVIDQLDALDYKDKGGGSEKAQGLLNWLDELSALHIRITSASAHCDFYKQLGWKTGSHKVLFRSSGFSDVSARQYTVQDSQVSIAVSCESGLDN